MLKPDGQVRILRGRYKDMQAKLVRRDPDMPINYWWCIVSDTSGNKLVLREKCISASWLAPIEESKQVPPDA